MYRQPVFLLFFLALVTLVLVNTLATSFFLYWLYLWLDIPMHALGGTTIALGIHAYAYRYRSLQTVSQSLYLMLGTVLLLGVGWEAYEYVIGHLSGMKPVSLADTALDVVMDLVGGFFAHFLARTVAKLDTHE